MADTLSKQERSERMRLVKSKNTRPELIVRKLCRELGHKGYRLHRKDLPGKPDIVFVGRKMAIFVHGCFWHGHACHGKVRHPKSNQDYWLPKIEKNKERDESNIEILESLGWRVLVVWECKTKSSDELKEKLEAFLC
ncbi:MAG: DNA mismatch endonuclease Vsr [Methylomicrobium sp.]|nr:DNA mismatch endonuclease Vsr [Methylomicrobium sp.]